MNRKAEGTTMMDKTKKQSLEKKGWKVGTATDFLGLSPEEEKYIEMKLALSEDLKKRRITQKITQGQLAKKLSSSQSRVAKMEAGDPTVSLDLLVRSLLTLGASEKELGKVIAAAH
jgi:DNA-binding XRE family transcriptional regulator